MPTSPAAASEVSRQCTNCERALPLTAENFYNDEPRCRSCANARHYRGRRFGIEIEFIGLGREAAHEALEAAGLPIAYTRDYTHEVMSEWKIVSDGSVAGYELVSPPLRGKAGARQVERACRALIGAGARVDRSCGVHVHFEVRDLSARAFGRLFRLWAINQPATDQLVARSRRNCRWAHPLSEDEVERIESVDLEDPIALDYVDRYRALNPRSFPRYGTVEVRQHQGSLDSKKILAWVEFGKALISVAKSAEQLPSFGSAPELLDGLLDAGGLSAANGRYLKARVVTLAGGVEQARLASEAAARRAEELREERELIRRQRREREQLAEREQRERERQIPTPVVVDFRVTREGDLAYGPSSAYFGPSTYVINSEF